MKKLKIYLSNQMNLSEKEEEIVYETEDKVFKNISNQKCTYSATGEELTVQMFYHCTDCGLDQDGDAICASCVRKCHKGHKTKYIGMEECFCDCVILFKTELKIGSRRRKRKLWLFINF
jgi:hypothetical protein